MQRKEKHPPLHLGVVANEKEAFESSLTTIANFTFTLQLVWIQSLSSLWLV